MSAVELFRKIRQMLVMCPHCYLSEPKTSNHPPYLSMLNNAEYNRVIRSALKCYIKDLQRSTQKINELYGDKVIPFNSITNDIELVMTALKKIE